MFRNKNSTEWRAVGLALGLLLLAGAVAFALERVEFSALRQAQPGQLLELAGCVVANLVLAATLFWVITLSFDAMPPVRWGRMVAVVCASALFNYLPMQAGSLGRAAYLKLRHGLPLRQSAVIMVIVAVITVLVPVVCVLVLVFVPGTLPGAGVPGGAVGIMVGLVLVCGGCTGPVVRRLIRRRMVAPWAWMPLRAADLFVTSLRMWIAFVAVGHPIFYGQALGLAAGVVVVNLLSFTPNGLGLREWSVAAMAGLIAPTLAPVGVLATLLDRGVEAVVLVVVGVVGSARLRSGGEEPSLSEDLKAGL